MKTKTLLLDECCEIIVTPHYALKWISGGSGGGTEAFSALIC